MDKEKVKILIVDDKAENIHLLQAILEGNGYETISAQNGKEALEQLRKQPVDLIVSDILMPKMDGFQLCRECKTDEKLCKIPFIFYTATYTDKKDEEFALNLGADRFIVKPIESAELLKIIEDVLKESRRGAISKAKKTIEKETVYLKEYSERLIRKLEDKNEQLQQELTDRKKAEAELYRVNRALKTLSGCNQRLIRATEKSTFLSEICQIIVGVGGYRLAWIGVAEQDEVKSVRSVAQAGFEAGYLETLNITWADTERGQGPTGTAIRTGKTCICRNILTDPKFAPWRDEAFKRGYASSIAFPIQFEDKVIGALNIYATATDAFNESEVELLTELSNDLAYGIVTLRVRDEHKKAEEALRESENRYRLLADNVTDVIFITDLNLRFTYVSPSAIGMFGYSTEEVVSKRLEEFLTPSSAEVAKKSLAEEMGIENNQRKGFFRARVL